MDKESMSIPQVGENELTPLERGLIGQVTRLIASVETWQKANTHDMQQLRKENADLLVSLHTYEQRINDLHKDISTLEKRLSQR